MGQKSFNRYSCCAGLQENNSKEQKQIIRIDWKRVRDIGLPFPKVASRTHG